MNVLDLFSGIGGFSLGLERAGMRTVAFCEIEPFCRAVLRRHWPDVPCYDDVRTLSAERLAADGIVPDVICGGFPCQDISVAGKGAGIEGERSGLWSEYARIIGEVRPRYVIVENVSALLSRGLSRVLGDLAALGYDAEWHCIPASAVGAPHRRDRFWAVAYPSGSEWRAINRTCGRVQWPDGLSQRQESPGRFEPDGETLADSPWDVCSEQETRGTERQRVGASGQSVPLANTQIVLGDGRDHHSRSHREGSDALPELGDCHSDDGVSDANGAGLSPPWPQPIGTYWRNAGGVFAAGRWWSSEPDVGRVAHGVPARVDRLRSLGNAVVPQIPEIIGRALMLNNTEQSQ